MKIQYVLKDDLMTFPESTRFDTVHDFETVVTHADHLEAVKQARADALDWFESLLVQFDPVDIYCDCENCIIIRRIRALIAAERGKV